MSGKDSRNKMPDVRNRRDSGLSDPGLHPGLHVTGSAVQLSPRPHSPRPRSHSPGERERSNSQKRSERANAQLNSKVDKSVRAALDRYPDDGRGGGGGGAAGGGCAAVAGAGVAGAGVAGGGRNVLHAEDELDRNMVGDGNIDENFEDYMIKVKTTISDKSKLRTLLPLVDKVLNEISATVFGAGAPLGAINPNAVDANCEAVYPICLQVTQEDLRTYGLNYGMALRKIYNKRKITSIPYIGGLIGDIKLASGAASLIISILSYRYTLIWVNNRLASLGVPAIVSFLQAFSAFCINPNQQMFAEFKSQHPLVFGILSQVTSGVFSMETCILLLHQFISRQNRLVAGAGAAPPGAAGAAAAGGGAAIPPPPRTILGWNLSFLQPVEGIIRTSGSAILKMCKPDLCWMGFDATLPIQEGVTTVDQFLSNILKNTSAQLDRMSPNENLLVVAHLTVKFGHTFSAFDGSIDKTEFKTVMVQERNAYVKKIIDSLMATGRNYLEARRILLDVFPSALDFSIRAHNIERDDASARSTGSSTWTMIGSTDSSRYRADQAVQEQAYVDNTVLSRITSTGIWFLKTAAETLLNGTQGVATLPGMNEPPVFARPHTHAQQRAMAHAIHAVKVFDQWVETVTSDAVFDMMVHSERTKVQGTTLTHKHVVNGVQRVKDFCRLTTAIRVIQDDRLLYVVNPDTVTGLKDMIRVMKNPLEAEVFNGCLSAILELEMMITAAAAAAVAEAAGQPEAAAAVAASARPLPTEIMTDPRNREMIEVGGRMIEQMVAPSSRGSVSRRGSAQNVNQAQENREIVSIAVSNSIPPAVVIDSAVNSPEGGGGGSAAADDSLNLREEVMEETISDASQVNLDAEQDAEQDAEHGGRSRSRKRSASKRTRRHKGVAKKQKSRRKARRSSSRRSRK